MIETILENSGYKRYNDNFRNAYCIYQKRIRDEKGIKYHITYCLYRDYFGKNHELDYEIDLRFEDKDCAFELLLFAFKDENLTEEKVKYYEEKIDEIWTKMNVEYYEEHE